MYAVIETGGKQYRVAPGDTIKIDSQPGEVNSAIEFGKVLAFVNDNNEMKVGGDAASIKVRGTVKSHGRGDKVIVFKFKRKKQYKKTIGHRQNYTEVAISEIVS